MANDTTRNPWIIDTASSQTITDEKVSFASIRWVGATTAGHQLIIKDKNARVVFEAVATGVYNTEESNVQGYCDPLTDWDGMAVTTLDSGTVYFTIR